MTSDQSTKPTVVYVGCVESGFDIFRHVHEHVQEISEVVTLTPEQAKDCGVSGYYQFSTYASQQGIDVYTPDEYGMDTKTDVSHFESLDPDVMIVHGWQRLIPSEILDVLSKGAFGLHGSAFGLPKGRGRSPMNWSLIEGLRRFLLSVMRLDEGADSGDVVATKKFDINEHDDIRSLYYKLVLAGQDMFEKVIPEAIDGTLDYTSQTAEPTYYPKRSPEDGGINWRDPTEVIHNLIRAVSHPYPGAFTEHDGERIYVWDSQPFSADFAFDEDPGTVLQTFTPANDFVVKTADGTLLVTDWESESWEPEAGDTLNSVPNPSIGSPNRIDRPDGKSSLSDGPDDPSETE